MAVSYIKLWKLLLDKRLKRVDLKELAGISSSTLAKLGRDDYLSMESMEKSAKLWAWASGTLWNLWTASPKRRR